MTLPYLQPGDPTKVVGAGAVDLKDDAALDVDIAGSLGARLAQAAQAGAPVARTMILASEVMESLRDDQVNLKRIRFGKVEEGEPAAIQALRKVWDIVGRGGLSPIVLLTPDPHPDPANGVRLSSRLKTWEDFLHGVAVVDASSRNSPVLAQDRASWATPITIHRAPRITGTLVIRAALEPESGWVTIDAAGRRQAPDSLPSHRRGVWALNDRHQARAVHATLTKVLDLFRHPVRIHALADEAGLQSITAIEDLT